MANVSLNLIPSRYEEFCPKDTGRGLELDYEDLKCSGTKVSQWRNQQKAFQTKFNRGRKCVQGRLLRMLEYDSQTQSNIDQRRSHVPPIHLAYTYAKDCLKKFTHDPSDPARFRDNVNNVIGHVAASRPDILNAQVLGSSDIETSIMGTRNNNLKRILNESYYSPSEWNTIYKGRIVDYLNGDLSGYATNNFFEYSDRHKIYQKMTRKRKDRKTNKTLKRR